MDNQSQSEMILKTSKIFSAGFIVSLILEYYFWSSSIVVLFIF